MFGLIDGLGSACFWGFWGLGVLASRRWLTIRGSGCSWSWEWVVALGMAGSQASHCLLAVSVTGRHRSSLSASIASEQAAVDGCILGVETMGIWVLGVPRFVDRLLRCAHR